MMKMLRLSLISLALTTLNACDANLGDLSGLGGTHGTALPGSGGAVGGVGTGGTSGTIGGTGGSLNGSPDGGAPSGSGAISGGDCAAGVLPPAVQAVLRDRCVSCHNRPPLKDVPTSLTSFADLTAPSASDPTRTNAQLALVRMQDTAKPMPPSPLSPATAAEIATMRAWVAAGTPKPACSDGGVADGAGVIDGGSISDAGSLPDPFSVAAMCSSKRTWTGGNRGDQQMNPGMACITCHLREGEAPRFAIAGTLYPTAHEPDLCNGASGGAGGAQVVIVGANGQQVTLTPNAAGNFSFAGTVSKPYKAKVVYMGRERAMIAAQTSGDCNSCHTQNGTLVAGAAAKPPGRIILP
jgi:hypothetical protein